MPDPPGRYGFQRGLCWQQGPFCLSIVSQMLMRLAGQASFLIAQIP